MSRARLRASMATPGASRLRHWTSKLALVQTRMSARLRCQGYAHVSCQPKNPAHLGCQHNAKPGTSVIDRAVGVVAELAAASELPWATPGPWLGAAFEPNG